MGIALNPHSEDRVICSLSNNTMYSLKLKKENEFSDHD